MATPEEMDMASDEAGQELRKIADSMNEEQKAAIMRLVAWWKKWYMKAGHKRLGRLIAHFTG